MDSILGSVDLGLIEFTSTSGRGILCLVEVANAETEHMRKDFIALSGADHSWSLAQSDTSTQRLSQHSQASPELGGAITFGY